jgi:hypothetical protein
MICRYHLFRVPTGTLEWTDSNYNWHSSHGIGEELPLRQAYLILRLPPVRLQIDNRSPSGPGSTENLANKSSRAILGLVFGLEGVDSHACECLRRANLNEALELLLKEQALRFDSAHRGHKLE